jgi:hypothetical protein
MSDEEEGMPVKPKQPAMPPSARALPKPARMEDQIFSFIDLSDDVASLAARRDIRSFAT